MKKPRIPSRRSASVLASVYALLHTPSGLYFRLDGPHVRLVDPREATTYPADRQGFRQAVIAASAALVAHPYEVQRLDPVRGAA